MLHRSDEQHGPNRAVEEGRSGGDGAPRRFERLHRMAIWFASVALCVLVWTLVIRVADLVFDA